MKNWILLLPADLIFRKKFFFCFKQIIYSVKTFDRKVNCSDKVFLNLSEKELCSECELKCLSVLLQERSLCARLLVGFLAS